MEGRDVSGNLEEGRVSGNLGKGVIVIAVPVYRFDRPQSGGRYRNG